MIMGQELQTMDILLIGMAFMLIYAFSTIWVLEYSNFNLSETSKKILSVTSKICFVALAIFAIFYTDTRCYPSNTSYC